MSCHVIFTKFYNIFQGLEIRAHEKQFLSLLALVNGIIQSSGHQRRK